MEPQTKLKERIFSIELKSKQNLKNITLADNENENVLVEGTLGELVYATFTEGIILTISGTRGMLSVDLAESEIQKPQNQNLIEMNNHE